MRQTASSSFLACLASINIPAFPHLLNVVHTCKNSISSLIENGELLCQFLLVVHDSKDTVPFPAVQPWPPADV